MEGVSPLRDAGKKCTYLKPGHLTLNSLLSSHNRNTAIFNTIAYLLLISSPIKTLICTFEVGLLQKFINQNVSGKILPVITEAMYHQLRIPSLSRKSGNHINA